MPLLITQPAQPAQAICLPEPRVPIRIRPGTMDDFAFIDGLQGKHTKQVGWMHRGALEGKIKLGHVLIAESDEATASAASPRDAGDRSPLTPSPSATTLSRRERGPEAGLVGFVIGNDQYFKRDDCGIIYQLCVVPEARRSLVGAMLVKAMFERAAWGCRLFCCWCAQDIEANRFWESLGFVPLAFRAGSGTKGKGKAPRIHIFWQKRIREGDTTTPYWFPSQTSGGVIREDRLVLPIPPDTHWSQVERVILPRSQPEPAAASPTPRARAKRNEAPLSMGPKRPKGVLCGFSFAPPPPPKADKPTPQKKPVLKNDPVLVAAARELRDRWIEAIALDPSALLPQGKYDIARALPTIATQTARIIPTEMKALPQAA